MAAPAELPAAGRCPRCELPIAADQRYCVDCGLRLPAAHGPLASFRRGWVRWFGWYPGDWAFPAAAALVIAAAGVAAAIELSRRDDGVGRTLAAATPPLPPNAGNGVLPAATRPARNGRTRWPADERGWTVVLSSFPSDLGPSPAQERARRAARASLPEVGVLRSDGFASLHPGYYLVFAGIYQTRAEAEAAVPTARSKGFGGAYARRVVP